MSKAICIGGALDGKIIEVETESFDDYNLHRIDTVLQFYVSSDMSTTAAIHKVFAAYEKKVKK